MSADNHMPEAIKLMRMRWRKTRFRRDLVLGLANLYVRDMRYDAAISRYQDCWLDRSRLIYYSPADVKGRKGDERGEAIDTFRRVGEPWPPSDRVPLLQLGLPSITSRDQAQPIYEQVLKLQPDHPIALNNWCSSKPRAGRISTAVDDAAAGTAGHAEFAGYHGHVEVDLPQEELSDDDPQYLRGEVDRAIPNRAAYHYHYGLALLQKGDKPSAKRELETAIKFNPSKDDAGKIRQLLATM